MKPKPKPAEFKGEYPITLNYDEETRGFEIPKLPAKIDLIIEIEAEIYKNPRKNGNCWTYIAGAIVNNQRVLLKRTYGGVLYNSQIRSSAFKLLDAIYPDLHRRLHNLDGRSKIFVTKNIVGYKRVREWSKT